MSCGSVLGAQRTNTVRAGGSSTDFSSAFAAPSPSRSASSTTTTRHRATVGIFAADRMTARTSSTVMVIPSVETHSTSGWVPARTLRHWSHRPHPTTSGSSQTSAVAKAFAATDRPDPGGPVSSQECVITPEPAASVEETERREREALESSLGVGSKGKGAAKAQRGASGQLKELEKEQKNRRTRLLRDSLDLALIDVAGLYRDAMLIAAGAVEAAPGDDGDGHGVPVGGLMHPDMAATSRELARRNSPEALVRCIDAVAACREALGFNVKPEVALDAMAGRLRECCRLV